MKRFTTYAEFWDFYLQEHSHPWTKRLHVLGTCLGVVTAGIAFTSQYYALLLLSLGLGYGLAWFSHFSIQKNRPATFRYPLWSFLSDFRMAYWYLTGRLR